MSLNKDQKPERDQFTKLPVLRLIKDEHNKTISIKKFIFLGDVVSYEDGSKSAEFDWEGPVIYVITMMEAFYISGDVDEFDKEINKYIQSLRRIQNDNND